MHALRHTHRLLVPGGTLVDLHPVTEERVEAGDRVLGIVPDPDWIETHLPNAETRLRDAVRDGLFEPIAETAFEIREHFDEAADLIEAKREHVETDPELVHRIREVEGPLVTREQIILRVLRAA